MLPPTGRGSFALSALPSSGGRQASMSRWLVAVLVVLVGCGPGRAAEHPVASPPVALAAPPQQVSSEEPTPPAAASSTGLASGTTAVVNGTEGSGLRVRADHSVTAPQVAVLADGVRVTILEGPASSGDYDWYRVRYDDQGATGW